MLHGVTLLVLLASASPPTQGALHYRLSYSAPGADQVQVRVDLPGEATPRTLVIPRAIPMGYGEAPYARFVSDVRAFGPEGEPLEVSREDGPRWRIDAAGDASMLHSLSYAVDLVAMEREILGASDASKMRPDYVGLLGYSVFGFVEGLEERPIQLELEGPESWPVFTTLGPEAAPSPGRARVAAADFYALADSQVAMGPALRVLRVGEEPALFVVGYGEAPWSIELTGSLGREALDALIDYFGPAPFPHYSMVIEVLQPLTPEHSYGFSMEHLDSATFFLGPEHALGESSTVVQRRRVLYNYAHHIAHAWVPKRCYGSGYFPFPWEFAPVLDTIWFGEGFGQYAAGVALADRLEDGAVFLEGLLEKRFRAPLAAAPASIRRMSTVELSRVASTRYSEDFRTGRNVFSRGAMMAAEMDAHIRAETDGAKSLRDALRYLVAWSAEQGTAFDAADLPALLEEGAGVDVRAIHARWMAPQD